MKWPIKVAEPLIDELIHSYVQQLIKSTEIDKSYLTKREHQFYVSGSYWIALETVLEHIEDQVGYVSCETHY